MARRGSDQGEWLLVRSALRGRGLLLEQELTHRASGGHGEFDHRPEAKGSVNPSGSGSDGDGTFWLLNVAITFSAPALSVNTISAMTVGVDATILQRWISPPIGSIADSMSAAVVPGAKLLPCTTYGPAKPRIL